MEVPRREHGIGGMGNEIKRGVEGLRVYCLAQDFVASVDRLLQRMPVRGSIGDQLRRAAESIVLNIAEGAVHISAGNKLNHYGSAHASAQESIAALQVIDRRYRGLRVRDEIRMANMIGVMMKGLINEQRKRSGP